MQNYKENHYKPFRKNGLRCFKWSGSLPVNYGNEKSNPKGSQTNIYSTDTTQGCSNNCIGCYGARLCVISGKNFGWIKNVKLKGKPSGAAFLWTTAPNPLPDRVLRSNIGVNVTIDPMRSISFMNKALRAIKALGPSRVVVVFRVYPGNPESKTRCLAIAKALRAKGYKRFIQVIVRLFSNRQADLASSVRCPKSFDKRKKWYKSHTVKGLGLVCGSIGSGKCIDCLYCYKTHKAKYRIGTSADPLDRPDHTTRELVRLGWI
jgi:hypothetical protein